MSAISPLSTHSFYPTGSFYLCKHSSQLTCLTPQFQFRSATSLTVKPILSSTDPGRSKPTNAFSDTDPDFLLSHIGPSHTLILNKYCVVRPQFILHTNDFVPQSDHLTESDLDAAWTVLSSLTRRKHIVIYNCGFEGWSSIGHKHLQILPRPSEGDGFEFFPDLLGISLGLCTSSFR
jgi:ATP adenylyltransferase/5',5'''-P-1,P-4-tetraphosphate phosphorylase II